MPPKRKASSSSSASSPPSSPTDPTTPSNAQLAAQREDLLAAGVVTVMDSSPLPPKQYRNDAKPSAENENEKSEASPSTPDVLGDGTAEQADSTQGVAACEETTGRKRKTATTETDAAPSAKRKKAAPKKTPVPRKNARGSKKTPKIIVEDEGDDSDAGLAPPTPLSTALKRKVRAVHAFLDAHPRTLLECEGDTDIVIVDDLDLLAALIFLRVDYELDPATTDVSLEDANEMIVARFDTGKVSVDFGRTCDTERAVREKLARTQTELEEVGLIELEVWMLMARRQQSLDDKMPAADFRVWGDEEVESTEWLERQEYCKQAVEREETWSSEALRLAWLAK